MASGSISMSSSKAWEGRIDWYSETSASANRSTVTARVYTWKTDNYPTSGGGWFEGKLTVGSKSVGISFEQCDPEETLVAELSDTIYHDGDGTASCLISCYITKGYSTQLAGVTCSGEENVELDLIPRASILSCDGGILGSEVALNIYSDSTAPGHTITYSCGGASGEVCGLTWARSLKWTPPIELASQAPSGTSVTVNLTLRAYIDGAVIGSSTVTVSFDIPDTVVPTVSAEISDAKGYADTYGGYIQKRSALSVVLTDSGAYGSSIVSRQISFDDKVYTSSRVTTEVIKGSGQLQMMVTVKDSRGRVGVTTIDVQVLTYEPPWIDNVTVQRCDQDGTRNKSGAYLIVTFDAAITALNDSLEDQNSASYKIQYKQSSASYYSTTTLENLAGQYSVTGEEFIFEADPSYSYNVVITATDNFGSTQKSANGPSKSVFWSRLAKGLGFAFGKVAEMAGHLDMGWHIFMNKNRVYGLPDPTADDEAVTLAYLKAQMEKLTKTCDESIKTAKQESLEAMYPIGAPYISFTNATSPDKILGFGTWVRVEGRFLLAAGSPDANTDNRFGSMSGTSWTIAAGSKGGQDYHSLTVLEMPSHTHGNVRTYSRDGTGNISPGESAGGDGSSEFTSATGGGEAHNNMPPYIAVYIWQRTA